MSRGLAMRRIVLPQAMRVIVPPTGNETIAMLKDTSLLIALPLTTEMFFQLSQIGSRTFQLFPVFVAATLYYLIATSVLMVGQAYLERRFGRGFGTPVKSDKDKATDRPAWQEVPSERRGAAADADHLVRARQRDQVVRPARGARRASTSPSTRARWSACSAPAGRARPRSSG